MIKKVVLFEGGIESLDYFSKQMGQAFMMHGLAVFYFNLREPEQSAKKVKKFIKSGETMMVTFSFGGLEREIGAYGSDGYIWRGYDMPIFNIVADHPYYYHNRFEALLDDEGDFPGLLKNYYHISIDRNHQKFMRTFYPMFKDGGFIPLAGTNPFPGEELTPMRNRGKDIIFTGNYTELSFFDQYINQTNEEYAEFYMSIINELIAHSDRTVEDVFVQRCNEEMGPQRLEDLRLPMHKTIFIDLYVRNYYRGEIIKTLVEEGFDVTVIGAGWDKIPMKKPNRLTHIKQTDSLECLRQIRDSRVSVNVMPWFRDGSHDRVFNSILNGSVCFSDRSIYLEEALPEKCGISYYDRADKDSICKTMENLLSDQIRLDEIMHEGYVLVEQNHTWKSRALQIKKMAEALQKL